MGTEPFVRDMAKRELSTFGFLSAAAIASITGTRIKEQEKMKTEMAKGWFVEPGKVYMKELETS